MSTPVPSGTNMLMRAKQQVWHVVSADDRFMVMRGDVAVAEWFGDHASAAENAASRNILEGHVLSQDVQQALIERAETLERMRLRTVAMVRRYGHLPGFMPNNTDEDIFTKLSRIIDSLRDARKARR